MKKSSFLLLAVVTLGPPAGALRAASADSQQMHQLQQQHKAQQKALKDQQRATKKAMGQQGMSSEQRRRLEKDLKMQEQILHKRQKDESRRLKQSQKAYKKVSHVPQLVWSQRNSWRDPSKIDKTSDEKTQSDVELDAPEGDQRLR